MFNFLKRKKEYKLLNDEDIINLRQIERDAYMEEAKKLAVNVGTEKAKKDFQTPKEKLQWQ